MKSFALLPAEVRRAVARNELRRRGLRRTLDAEWTKVLPFFSNASLEQAEDLLTRYPGANIELPFEARERWSTIFRDTVRAMREAGVPDTELAKAVRLMGEVMPPPLPLGAAAP